MSFVQMLRAATAVDHQRVDDRFGGFTLDDADDYRRFLLAHGRALPAVEAVLAQAGDEEALPSWRPRTALLAADLAALGQPLPVPLAFEARGPARWGALYVIEGSRLGGQLLARAVPAGLPASYLAARHAAGEWRALLAALDVRAAAGGAEWAAAALAGAQATFALYGRAADQDAMATRSLPSRLAE
ncbi:biliverdin-producing heme oxygenase [Sphingomonas sp. A2-49]|uniref:biliverdin-producing heme oxygenase n=1 Tax=Sphingomonas sp. A2-49 TaxID=1391375 RepID=UPI0021D3A9ED|nr:biliverdin-producing heme oxygenase [Sphingomonas sp. A2-49]MCU6454383.1 biliverdin-producing heme oxygenase [Sphingomonas sp. A2-49]